MKKRLILSFVIIFLLAIPFASAITFGEIWSAITGKVTVGTTCIDSDGGKDYYVAGEAIGSYYNSSDIKKDVCNFGQYEGIISEAFCNSEGFVFYDTYECPNGCKDGVCINASTDLQPPVIVNASSIPTELMGKTITLINVGSSGAINIDVNGYIKTISKGATETLSGVLITNLNTYYDPSMISKRSATLEILGSFYELKVGEKIIDGKKIPLGAITDSQENITLGTTCTDTDGGKNIYVAGETKQTRPDGTFLANKDECWGVTNQLLSESYCEGGELKTDPQIQCPNGCSNSACLSQTPNCTDTDLTNDIYTKGYATIDNGKTKIYDHCATEQGGTNTNSLTQVYCENNKIETEFYQCPNGCKDGVCINASTDLQPPVIVNASSIPTELMGKTITLINVGSSGAIIIDVNGEIGTVSASGTETINGVEINNDATFYDPSILSRRSATLGLSGLFYELKVGEKIIDGKKTPQENITPEVVEEIEEESICGDGFCDKDKGEDVALCSEDCVVPEATNQPDQTSFYDACSTPPNQEVAGISDSISGGLRLLNVGSAGSALIGESDEQHNIVLNIDEPLNIDGKTITLKSIHFDAFDRYRRTATFEINGQEDTVGIGLSLINTLKDGKSLFLLNVGSKGSAVITYISNTNMVIQKGETIESNGYFVKLIDITFSDDRYLRQAKFESFKEQEEVTILPYTDVTPLNLKDFFSAASRGITVVGDFAVASDTIAAVDVSTVLPLHEVTLSSEVTNPRAQDLVLVGGSYVNPLVTTIFNLELSDFKKNEALIRAVSFGDKKALLVAGYSPCDTRNAAWAVAKGLVSDIARPEVIIQSTAIGEYTII